MEVNKASRKKAPAAFAAVSRPPGRALTRGREQSFSSAKRRGGLFAACFCFI